MKITISRPGILLTAALLVSASLQGSAQVGTQATKPVAGTTATPRRADGKPELNGVWTEPLQGVQGQVEADGSGTSLLTSRMGGLYSVEIDGAVLRKGDRNKPMYRPEYWQKVRHLELHRQEEDPELKCQPWAWGVPHLGQPQQIVHQDNLLVFLYAAGGQSTSYPNVYRVIPLNRPHNAERVSQDTARGDSVGHWEGDTLVVDTIGLNDETWLTGRLGYFHSTDLHVVERFTRAADKIEYEVIVEDPKILLEPWVWAPRTMTFNPHPDAMLLEDFPCSERDSAYTEVR